MSKISQIFLQMETYCIICFKFLKNYYKLFRRPGILVLINDTDWELEGKEEAIIKNSDNVGFISTLHGG